jgi:hypothetical protein
VGDLAIATIIGAAIGVVGALGGALLGSLLDRSSEHKLEEVRDELVKITHREVERHRFRHEIGHVAARERMTAYMKLGELATRTYRKTMGGGDWKDPQVVAAALGARNEAKNYFYDHHYFFSSAAVPTAASTSVGDDRGDRPTMEKAFREFDSAIALDPMPAPPLSPRIPNPAAVESALRQLINTIRADLLLDELSESARRAISAGRSEDADVVITSP